MLNNKNRWDLCIDHYGSETHNFFSKHFKDESRKCLYIGGAGFDPRSTAILRVLFPILVSKLESFLIKEERPDPDPELTKRADINLKELQGLSHSATVKNINIFADDNAVVGGINILKEIRKISLEKYTDIVIDLSALSVGVSYPIVAYIYKAVQKSEKTLNLHVTVSSNYLIDLSISSISIDRVSDVRGFSIGDLFGDNEKAKLWLPLISSRRKNELNKIHSHLAPHDTFPIIPFPSENPKKGDNLVIDFMSEIENEWVADTRNFIYADEHKPLDLYRTILRLHKERELVFDEFGGSVLILSPLGDRMPALGMLMAALERSFPVAYIETLEYHVDWNKIDNLKSNSIEIFHIWLYGEAYHSDLRH